MECTKFGSFVNRSFRSFCSLTASFELYFGSRPRVRVKGVRVLSRCL